MSFQTVIYDSLQTLPVLYAAHLVVSSSPTGMHRRLGFSKSSSFQIGPSFAFLYHTVLRRGAPFFESGFVLPPVTFAPVLGALDIFD